jgi:hypothetical protein
MNPSTFMKSLVITLNTEVKPDEKPDNYRHVRPATAQEPAKFVWQAHRVRISINLAPATWR